MNASQKSVVLHNQGPLLVLAGAGSGKTRVLTMRIARLVKEKLCDPDQILAVTFTNKAAREMKERMVKLLSSKAADAMTVSTFHSFGARVLRQDGEPMGLQGNYSILDENERMSTIRTLMRGAGASPAKEKEDDFSTQISMFKNASRDPADVAKDDSVTRKAARIYKAYRAVLLKRQSVDFDDLLLLPLQLFKSHADSLAKYQNQYRYICIDEYQDTNPVQMQIAQMLAATHHNIMAVGDDDQSIYSWRGACSTNILDFASAYPGCTSIVLDKNYRSTRQILSAAYAVVEKNRVRKPKNITAVNGDGEQICHFRGDDEDEESAWVAQSIVDNVNRKEALYSGHALLFRTNAMMSRFETALRQVRVPYRIVGGMSFFDRKEVKDILAHLRFMSNPADELSMMRVLKAPDRGISKMTLELLEELAGLRGIGLFDAFERHEVVEKIQPQFHARIADFVSFARRYQEKFTAGSMGATLRELLAEINYTELLKKSCAADNADPSDRLAVVEEIVHNLETYELRNKRKQPTLAGFIHELSLSSSDDNDDDRPGQSRVSFMTIHKAKGLEFPIVYMVGLDDTVFPSSRSIEEGNIEEERRLFYVAMTRAKQRLVLTYARTKVYRSQTKEVTPSRFLFEIPEEFLERPLGQKEETDRQQYMDDFFGEMKKKLAEKVEKYAERDS